MLGVAVFHPGLAWAAAVLALVPLIIYLLNRRRYRHVPWAAMQFLMLANRKSRRRTRLEQLLLLIIRTVVLSGLALSLARPFWPSSAAPKLLGGSRHHILVLDDSASLSAKLAGSEEMGISGTIFDWQIRQVLQLLEEIPSGDPVTVITLGHPAKVLNRALLYDRSMAARVVNELAAGEGGNDLPGAVQRIEELPVEEGGRRRAVYLFSDFTNSLLARLNEEEKAELGKKLRALQNSAELVLFDVGAAEQENLGITRWQGAGALVSVEEPVTLVGSVRNFGTRRCDPTRVQILVDNRLIREEPLPPIEAGAEQSFQSTLLIEKPGWMMVEARLAAEQPDGLRLDDKRYRVVRVPEGMDVLLVDGKPGREPRLGEAGYLMTAWAPRLDRNEAGLIQPQLIKEHELSGMALERFAVIALCNVRRLPEEVWRSLYDYVAAGGGLLIFVGDLVESDHYNQAAGDWLPAQLGGRVFAQPGGEEFVRIDPQTLAEPLAADFVGRERSGLFLARIDQYLQVQGERTGRGRELARYSNGDPAVVSGPVGVGGVVLVTTTANMAWNNLPAKGDYVTFTVNLLRHLVTDRAGRRNLEVGEIYQSSERVPDAGSLLAGRLTTPAAKEWSLELQHDARGYYVQTPPLLDSGWYRLRMIGGEEPLAVNTTVEESDISRLDSEEINELFQEPPEIRRLVPGGTASLVVRRHEAAAVMIYAVILLLLVESLLAMLFGHQK